MVLKASPSRRCRRLALGHAFGRRRGRGTDPVGPDPVCPPCASLQSSAGGTRLSNFPDLFFFFSSFLSLSFPLLTPDLFLLAAVALYASQRVGAGDGRPSVLLRSEYFSPLLLPFYFHLFIPSLPPSSFFVSFYSLSASTPSPLHCTSSCVRPFRHLPCHLLRFDICNLPPPSSQEHASRFHPCFCSRHHLEASHLVLSLLPSIPRMHRKASWQVE